MAQNEVSAIDWASFFLFGWGAPFTAYVIAQLIGVVHFKGSRRIVVGAPLPLMLLVAVVTFTAYAKQSNLWPIWMILASPVALAYVVVVGGIMQVRQRRQGTGPGAI